MKTQKVKFSDIPVGAWFYDWSKSSEWLYKIDVETAMWEDGLQTTFCPDEVVEITYPQAAQ